jgi:hypothetical protein
VKLEGLNYDHIKLRREEKEKKSLSGYVGLYVPWLVRTSSRSELEHLLQTAIRAAN